MVETVVFVQVRRSCNLVEYYWPRVWFCFLSDQFHTFLKSRPHTRLASLSNNQVAIRFFMPLECRRVLSIIVHKIFLLTAIDFRQKSTQNWLQLFENIFQHEAAVALRYFRQKGAETIRRTYYKWFFSLKNWQNNVHDGNLGGRIQASSFKEVGVWKTTK